MKKIFRKLRIKNKNKGFSLLEVLLAIAILALIATPVFNTIVSSYKLNLKSRKILAASDVVNATMEYASSMTMENYKYSIPDTSNPGTFKDVSIDGLNSVYGTVGYTYDFSNGFFSVYPGSDYGAVSVDHKKITLEDLAASDVYPYIGPKMITKKAVDVTIFSEVKYNGYSFDVLVFRASPETTTDKYFTTEFGVAVYDHELKDSDGKLIKYTDATTKIINVK